MGFDSFEEHDKTCDGYLEKDLYSEALQSQIRELCAEQDVTFQYEMLENKNWNEMWESSFQPVNVGNFCRVRADFHPPDPEVIHDIIINPKMAFGTGHHETTYMMIQSMADIDFRDRSVFDYGCGTAILAVLARKLGSGRTLAIDIEEESAANSQENAEVNSVTGIDIRQATIEDINEEPFDLILANINRQVLLDSADQLYKLLDEDGVLLISGIMSQDKDKIDPRYVEVGFVEQKKMQKGDWLCIHYHKS